MPRLTIDGQTVNVDDSFLKLSPEQQNATVEEIAKSLPSKRSGTIGETVDAAVRGAANAITFGFADRLAAAAGSATGIGGKSGDYEGNLAQQRAIDAANMKEHPYATIGGEVAGSLALPVGGAMKAATLPGRMAAGAGLGAAQGAAYGVGASPDLSDAPEVAKNALVGAGTGALVGGVAPPLVEGAGNLIAAGLRKTGVPQAIAGMRNPEGSAARIVADAMERDAAAGSTGLGQNAFNEAVQAGQPVVNADLGGAATKRLARTAANMSPGAESTLNRVANERFESQGPRVADMLTAQGGGNSVETLDRLKNEARKANRPLYQKAYAEGANGIWNPELEQLTAAPAVQDAIRGAIKTGANADVALGLPATKSPFAVAQDGTLSLVQKADGSTAVPSLQFWDHVKRNLDDRIEAARRSGENHAAAVATSLKDTLVSELDKAAPTYAAARGMAAKAFGAQDALEAGAKFVGAKGKNQEYAKTIAQMSGPERQLFAHGFLSELENKVREAGDRRNVVNQIFSSPAARQRIEMAVGKGKAAQIETFLHAETIMDQLRNAVQGNSTTAKQLADIAALPMLVGGGTMIGSGDIRKAGEAATLTGAVQMLAKKGSAKINSDVMRHVGELLASNDSGKISQAISTIKASKPLQEVLSPFAPKLANAMLASDADKRRAYYQQGMR